MHRTADMPRVDIFVGVIMQAMAELVAHVVALFRRFWPAVEWGRPVEPARAAAAVGILAIAAPLGYVAVGALRLTALLMRDQLLIFLALLLAPVLLFAAVLAAMGLAAGLAIALGVAAGTSRSSIYAWGFVMVGGCQVVTYLQIRWHLLAALTAAATAIEIVLLLSLSRDRTQSDTPRPVI